MVAGYVGSGLSQIPLTTEEQERYLAKWIGIKRAGKMFAYGRPYVIPRLTIFNKW